MGIFKSRGICAIICGMLDVKLVQERPDYVIQKMADRGLEIDLDEFLTLSEEKKKFLRRIEDLRYEQNKTSKLIGQMKKQGKDS